MSYGHITPVRIVARLIELLKCWIKFLGDELSDLLDHCENIIIIIQPFASR